MMRRNALLIGIALLLGMAPGGMTVAQSQTESALAIETRVVSIPVTVRNEKNRLERNLRPQDFRLYEDGREVEIAYFALDTTPTDVILLVDASLSVKNELSSLQEAAFEFARKLKPNDRISIWSFSHVVRKMLGWTSPGDDLRIAAALRSVESGGDTSLYDAIAKVLKNFDVTNHDAASQSENRRCVVVLTDGDDTSSRTATPDDLVREALRTEAATYVVSRAKVMRRAIEPLMDSERVEAETRLKLKVQFDRLKASDEIMTRLAERTGGRAIFPSQEKDLTQAYVEIAEELHRRYNLGFSPSDGLRDEKFHRLKIETRRSGLRIWAREGYFAK
jgi:VWFA-related protein